MSTFRVYVIAENSDDVTVGSWFTLEADDDVDAANEAVTAATDCGWKNIHTTRVILADFRGDRDEHSGSRRLEVLEQQAPHLIAPDADELEALEPMDPRADVALLTPAQLEQLATDHPETAPAVVAELVSRLEQRRPEPTTVGGDTAHDLAREILEKPGAEWRYSPNVRDLAALVLRADSLEELEQA